MAGEIDFSCDILGRMENLLKSGEHADVTFIVENTTIRAHKFVLFFQTSYFDAFFNGGIQESAQDVFEPNVSLGAFNAILRFFYTGRISMNNLPVDELVEVMNLADMYGFNKLKSEIVVHLKSIVSLENCCAILNTAHLHSFYALEYECSIFMDQNATKLLAHETFNTLSTEALYGLLDRNSFVAPEDDIFKGVCKWLESNPDADEDKVKSVIRWPLLSVDMLMDVDRSSKMLKQGPLLDVIDQKLRSTLLPHRIPCYPEENVASAKFQANIILGDIHGKILKGQSEGLIRDYERILELKDSSFWVEPHVSNRSMIVKLGTVSLINCILLALSAGNYSYYIEVSEDQVKWEKVIDRSKYLCDHQQYLFFAPRSVRYIRLVDTSAPIKLKVCSLKAGYQMVQPEVVGDLIKPTYNVATPRTIFACFGNFVLIKLHQPYIIDSLRFLVEMTASIHIKTSIDFLNHWETLVDRRNVQLNSWQSFTFDARPVQYIRITGLDGPHGIRLDSIECRSLTQ